MEEEDFIRNPRLKNLIELIRKNKPLKFKISQTDEWLKMKLYELMENEGFQNFTHDEYGKIYRSQYVWCRIDNQEQANNFLKENNIFDEIMQLKPQARRLNSYISENYIDKGLPVPEADIGITVTLTPRIGRRSGQET